MNSVGVIKGDVVLVDVPYLDATHTVRRPALVVGDTSQMLHVIVAGITSRIRSPLPATHFVIDHSHPDWSASGSRTDSAVRCDRLFTVAHANVHRKIGQRSKATMQGIDGCLKVAFAIA